MYLQLHRGGPKRRPCTHIRHAIMFMYTDTTLAALPARICVPACAHRRARWKIPSPDPIPNTNTCTCTNLAQEDALANGDNDYCADC